MARDYGIEGLNIEQKTKDAYSVRRYSNWRACAIMLLKRGYTAKETEAILRSKITRWAADHSNYPERATSKDLARYIDARPEDVKAVLEEQSPKPKCKLTGTDGNVFSVIGTVSAALKKADQKDKATEFTEKAFTCASYDEVLRLCFEYVDVR